MSRNIARMGARAASPSASMGGYPDEARSQAKTILGAVETARTLSRSAGPLARCGPSGRWRRLPGASRRYQAQGPHGSGISALAASPMCSGHRQRAASSTCGASTWLGCMPRPPTPARSQLPLRVVSAVWNWAARRDEVEASANPVRGIERYPEQGRERFLTSEEFARLGSALAEGVSIGLPYEVDETSPKAKHAPKAEKRRVKLDPFAVAAIRLLILTGARLREILDAQWSQVDLERGVIFLADSKTRQKAGLSFRRRTSRSGGAPAHRRQPAYHRRGEGWRAARGPQEALGGGDGGSGIGGREASRLSPFLRQHRRGRVHGLAYHRQAARAFSSRDNARYAHLDADPLRRAVDTIGATITAAMDKKSTDNVVTMGTRQK